METIRIAASVSSPRLRGPESSLRSDSDLSPQVGRGKAERGFTLLEMLCVLAIIGLIAAVALPAMPRATSRTRLEGLAVQAATLLRRDREAALRRQIHIVTEVDAARRWIRSGMSDRSVSLPGDVTMTATLASHCSDRIAGKSIEFFPSGMSCGGAIALQRPGMWLEIRVNWLTGGVEIVPKKTL
jgi:general secretion pathway protein H